MKHYFAAAGALLLGTSTLALAADVKPLETSGTETTAVATDTKVATEAKAVGTSFDKTTLAAKPELDASSDAKVELASLDRDLVKLASAETDAKVQTAFAETDAKVQTAFAETDAKVQTASADTFGKSDATGMGGPIETDATTTASLTPQPAAQNYPPCDPGPGDDRCIQLYEDGVREQLASWNRPTGGLLDNSATTAMGGPFEPVDAGAKPEAESESHLTSVYKPESGATESGVGGPFEPLDNDATEIAMNGDGTIDASAGETAVSETTGAVAQAEVTDHSGFTGVGGPIEAQSGYPPCDPGPGDDRCIQLYEAGVSGAGN